MPRQLRREYAGALYHVTSRGNRDDRIFEDDEDRLIFLRTLGEACGKAAWEVHAYCLMDDHFHLAMETPQPTLVAGMKWLLGTYTARHNARHRRRGHVFAGRYRSLLVDECDDNYLKMVCDYVHLNPVRSGLIPDGTALQAFAWSSFPEYLKAPRHRASWLNVTRLLKAHGIRRDDPLGRKEFARRMAGETGPDEIFLGQIRRGWKLGREDFAARLGEADARAQKRGSYLAAEFGEAMEAKARRIIAEELQRLQLETEDLARLARMDSRKGDIAQRLRSETTMTMEWIAKELSAGTAGTLGNTLHRKKKIAKCGTDPQERASLSQSIRSMSRDHRAYASAIPS